MFESFKYRKRFLETDEQRYERIEWERKRFFESLLLIPPMVCVIAFVIIALSIKINPYKMTTGKIISRKVGKYGEQINTVEYKVDDEKYIIDIKKETNSDTIIIYYHKNNPIDASNNSEREHYQERVFQSDSLLTPCIIIFVLVAVIEYILLFRYRKKKKELDKIVLTDCTADELRDKYLKKTGYVYYQQKKNYGGTNFQYNVKTCSSINGETKKEEYSGIADNSEEAQVIMNEILEKVNDKLDDGIENNSNKK